MYTKFSVFVHFYGKKFHSLHQALTDFFFLPPERGKNVGLDSLYAQLTFIKIVIFATYYAKYWGSEMSKSSFSEGVY